MKKGNLKQLTYVLLGLLLVCCTQQDMQEGIIKLLEIKYSEQKNGAEFVTVSGVPVAQKTGFIQPDEELLPENVQVKQIALIRHGEPDLRKTGNFSYEEAKKYVKNYDSVGIIIPNEPFFNIAEEEETAFFSSNINRARTTAQYLFGTDKDFVVSSDFREFERRVGDPRFKMRLPLKYWTTSARVLWMLGYDREGIESFKDARTRAQKAAKLLAEASEVKPNVVLVAHGFLNRYIKKNLEKMGWKVVRDGGRNYFATTILAKVEPTPVKDELISQQDL